VLAGSYFVRDTVRRDPRLRFDNWRLTLDSPPAWVSPEIAAEIESIGLESPGAPQTVLDRGALDWIRSRVEASPWVRTVRDLEFRYPCREGPGELGADLALRRPVAALRHGAYFYLADSEARRLGSPYHEAPVAWFRIVELVGLEDPGELPLPGGRWANRDVWQGVEVARILRESGVLDEPSAVPITAVDLSNLHGRLSPSESEVSLVRGRQRLLWGRSPISTGARTATVAEILSRLRDVLSQPDLYDRYAVIHLHRGGGQITGVRG
jgi:hypothetical protein